MKIKNTIAKKIIVILFSFILMMQFVVGCADGHSKNKLEDGEYTVDITMEGGTGKAYIKSPAALSVDNGELTLTVVWSSVNYDYMIVDGVKYLNEADGSESTFTFPIKSIEEPLDVIGDTVAMSTPHEIEYVLHMSIVE